MKNIIEYSVLYYYNSFLSEECLAIGILFNNKSTNIRKFEMVKKLKRVEVFDDEINIDFFKANLEGIKFEAEDPYFNYHVHSFKMEEFIKRYVNEYKFSKPQIIKNERSAEDIMLDIKKVYLKYDFEKKERMNRKEEKRFLKEYMNSNNINHKVNRSLDISEYTGLSVKYDFYLEELKYAIKVLSFKDKTLSRMIPFIKSYSWDALALKEEGIKTIFIFDVELNQEQEYNTIIKILEKDSHKVIKLNESVEFLDKINKSQKITLEN